MNGIAAGVLVARSVKFVNVTLVTLVLRKDPDGFVENFVHVPLIHINKIEMLQPTTPTSA